MAVPPVVNLEIPRTLELRVSGADGIAAPEPSEVGEPQAVDVHVDFADVLTGMVGHAAELHQLAQNKALDFARGRANDLHGTMIAAKEAQISLELVAAVRNKLLDAFHDLWRMNV